MRTNIISKVTATIILAAILIGCGTVGNRSNAVKHDNHDAPRGQIGHIYAVRRSASPRGQIGHAYGVNIVRIRKHILLDNKRFV